MDLRLEARDLSLRSSSGRVLLDSVTVGFASGEFCCLAGLNGAGKSLLLKCMVGLLRPTAGAVFLDGTEISRVRDRLRTEVGMVMQESHLQILGQTVEEDVAFTPRALGLDPADCAARVEDALAITGLGSRRTEDPQLLSGGERRRLCLAGILAHRPRLVLLDEPFTGLDAPSAETVLLALRRAHEEGVGVVVAGHDLHRLASVAGRLVRLDAGKLVANEPFPKGLGG